MKWMEIGADGVILVYAIPLARSRGVEVVITQRRKMVGQNASEAMAWFKSNQLTAIQDFAVSVL